VEGAGLPRLAALGRDAAPYRRSGGVDDSDDDSDQEDQANSHNGRGNHDRILSSATELTFHRETKPADAI
jgi:hypothetical protein